MQVEIGICKNSGNNIKWTLNRRKEKLKLKIQVKIEIWNIKQIIQVE